MQTSIIFEGDKINVSSKWANKKPSTWDSTSHNQHHRIYISANGSTLSFDYWASKAEPRITTDEQLLSALHCYASDACYGEYEFEEFCDELGYEQFVEDDHYGDMIENKTARQSWTACQKARNKFDEMGIDNSDLYNWMSEKYEL